MKKEYDRDFVNVIFFAFRYALGRYTSAPYIICDFVQKHIDEIDHHSRKQMIKEINEFEPTGHIIDQYIYRTKWRELKAFLVESLSVEDTSSSRDRIEQRIARGERDEPLVVTKAICIKRLLEDASSIRATNHPMKNQYIACGMCTNLRELLKTSESDSEHLEKTMRKLPRP